MHRLDMLQNACDSLDEALTKYQAGREGDVRELKFAVLHISHFLELIFKHYVSSRHPLLLYKNPFSKNIGRENTISLWDAIQFLKNEQRGLDKQFVDDLEWLKRLRNDIEHSRFEMSPDEVKRVMGRVLNAFAKFNETHGDVDFHRSLRPATYDCLQEFADDYKLKLNSATDEVRRRREVAYAGLRPKEWGEVEWYELLCPECGHETFVPDAEADTENAHICTFCGNTDSEEIPEECSVCGDKWPLMDMEMNSGPDEHGDYFRVCPNCQERWDKQ